MIRCLESAESFQKCRSPMTVVKFDVARSTAASPTSSIACANIVHSSISVSGCLRTPLAFRLLHERQAGCKCGRTLLKRPVSCRPDANFFLPDRIDRGPCVRLASDSQAGPHSGVDECCCCFEKVFFGQGSFVMFQLATGRVLTLSNPNLAARRLKGSFVHPKNSTTKYRAQRLTNESPESRKG